MIFHQSGNSVGNYNYNTRIYRGIKWDAHFHGNYEIIYSIYGVTEICINGIWDKLMPGEMVLISPYSVHSLSVDSRSCNWVGVFSADYVVSFSSIYKFKRFSKFRCDPAVEDFLKSNLFNEKIPEHYMLCACLYMACNECIKNADSHDIEQTEGFTMKVVEYVSENIRNNISMRDTAHALNYEYHYFSYLFHHSFSMSFKSFLNYFKLESACKLLLTSNKSITEICGECGFGSVRSFNRVFKESFGKTPVEYRKSIP